MTDPGNRMIDPWDSADSYELFMGRWSKLVSKLFIDWLSRPAGLKWLDVGCGSGALSEVVIEQLKPIELTAIDQSENYVAAAQIRLGIQAKCRVGNALDLPLEDSSVDVTVSGLALNFIPQPVQALAEMRRVTVTGGTVALYIWDYAGKMELLNQFWDAAIELDSGAMNLHEGARFPDSNAEVLNTYFENVGFANIETIPIEVCTLFRDFDDYWEPFLGGQGPAPSYLLSLSESDRSKLKNLLHERLPVQADGSIPLNSRAWAAKGRVK